MKTDCQRLLDVLKDGKPHGHNELYALGMIVHSRVADLRARGHRIVCEQERIVPRHGFGRAETIYRYRLVGSLDAGGHSVVPPASSESAATAPASLPGADSLDSYGLDQAVAEANAEHPGMLVEPDRPQPIEQQTLWAAAR